MINVLALQELRDDEHDGDELPWSFVSVAFC